MAKVYNKAYFGGEKIFDLTADTVSKSTVLSGVTFHDKTGNVFEGECTFDSNTQDANVAVAEILATKTAYARGTKLTGTMPNNGAYEADLSTKSSRVSIPQGYHDGGGSIGLSVQDISRLIPQNLREGINILGVVGEMSGSEDENPEESIEITPSKTEQNILPSEGYTCFREVIVKAIPVVESDNAFGTTITIG